MASTDLSEPVPGVVELAQRLVAAGIPDAPWDTRAACDVLEAALPDVEVRRLEPASGHRSLIAEWRFDRPGPMLVLCGHLDVVPAGADSDWSIPPFAGIVESGLLYGRGSCDMKGAVAGLVVAARHVAGHASLRGRLVLALVADEEEGGGRGAGAFVAAMGARPDGVIVAEPSDGAVCTSHRGMCFVDVVTRGRSGHASQPEVAENAVELMVDVLARLRTVEFSYDRAATAMTPGLAIGTTISGGVRANVVPDRCHAVLDVRKVTGMSDDSVLADLRAHLSGGGLDLRRIELGIGASGEPVECREDTRIVCAARQAYERVTGRRPPLTQFPAATDGFWFANRLGAPTVVAFGPGRLADCHVIDEHINIAELETWARIYAASIETFLGVC